MDARFEMLEQSLKFSQTMSNLRARHKNLDARVRNLESEPASKFLYSCKNMFLLSGHYKSFDAPRARVAQLRGQVRMPCLSSRWRKERTERCKSSAARVWLPPVLRKASST